MAEPIVGVVMGSDSDLAVMRQATEVLAELGIAAETRVVSAHRTPTEMLAYGQQAEERGLAVIIAGAGGAAHLPGMLAAVILEPVVHNAPGGTILPQPGFLEGLRAICDREGAVLIFDEVITGFRHGLGGYQGICGVMPDLTTVGKAVANGFPLAAIGGKRELMEQFNTHPEGDVWYGGTYNGSSPSVAAALATIAIMERESVHEHIFALGQRMRDGLTRLVRERALPLSVGGFGSLFVLSFYDSPARDFEDASRNDTERFLAYRRALVARGCLEIPEDVGRSHISYSHTEADIDESLATAAAALDTLSWREPVVTAAG